jgi:hypothetical protein
VFGLKVISKRELSLYAAQIAEMKEQNDKLSQQVQHERKRAEAAINALLIRTARLAITPMEGMSLAKEMEMKESAYDIFGDGNHLDEEKALEELQR